MLKNKLYQKLLVAGITGSLIISSGIMVSAATSKSDTTPKSAISSKFAGDHKGEGKEFMQKGNPLTAILAKEVTAGVITQAESDKITAFLKTKEDAQKAEMTAQKAKLDAMTDAERKAYCEANKPVKADILAEIVTANLLTQTQADTIKAAMPQGPAGGEEKCKAMQKGNPLTAVLKTQVTAGVITQEVSDKATAFLKTKEDATKVARDAEKAKVEAMSDAEKKAYREANKPAKENILSELVTAGILTQDQADKIQAAMPQRPEMKEGFEKYQGGDAGKGFKAAGASSVSAKQ